MAADRAPQPPHPFPPPVVTSTPGPRYPGAEGRSKPTRLIGVALLVWTTASSAQSAEPAGAPAGEGVNQTLAPVKVQGTRVREGTTEGTGSYAPSVMDSATRLPLTTRQTPQSVTVITRERMDDQVMIKASDALQNTPGITVTSISGPNREVYYSRGFMIENYTFDGHPVTMTTSGGQVLLTDMAMFDRVEVVRGATGLTQGVGSPAGAINFIRKRPTREFQASVQGQIGSWNHLGVEADLSGALNAAGSLRARAVAHWREADSFQDVASERRKLLYLIAEADLTPDTLLTASLSHQRGGNVTTYSGLPTARDGGDLRLSRSTFLGNRWNFWDEKNTMAYASLEQRLAGGWKASLSANRIWGEQDRFVNGILLNETQYDQTGLAGKNRTDRASYDIHARGPYTLFGRQHDLVVGAAARSGKDYADVAGYWPAIPLGTNIDIYNWTHDAARPASIVYDFYNRNRDRQRGFYGTTRLNVTDSLKVLLGLRVDWFRYTSWSTFLDHDAGTWEASTTGHEKDRNLTKYAGILYDVDRHHTVYASYADIFKPQSERNTANQFVDPIVGKNYEIGVKGSYAGGALNGSAAIIRVDQDNLAMPDGNCPFNPRETCYRSTGLARSQGFDLEVLGSPLPGWQIGAGFTHATTKTIRDSEPEMVGVRLRTQLPARQFKLMTTYQLPDGKWRIGGALRWQSKIYHDNDWMGFAYHTEQKAYALVDAMVAYRWDARLSLQLNVTNLFDKTYYREINTQPVEWGGNTLYGQPRRVMLTARYHL